MTNNAQWLDSLINGQQARPVQAQAIAAGLLETRNNFLISAPTNSGKSLVGTLALIKALSEGKRAVLLEPLRALAREQTETLEALRPKLEQILGKPINIRLSTGDVRLDDEQYNDNAPTGELVVATPERLEAIMRNPANKGWISHIGAVCIDEAHMISDTYRGATLEYLITTLLTLASAPRLILLSATLSNTETIEHWLSPCTLIKITERHPPLQKSVLELSAEQDINEAIGDWLKPVLDTPEHQVIIFVYQTRAAVSLAKQLSQTLTSRAGKTGAVAYHGQMSAQQRNSAKQAFLSGESRIVVTTSALAMGVNLPATHVVVRDLSYPGARNPGIGDLLQMMGRAGRGDTPGQAVVFKRATDDHHTPTLIKDLEEENLPPFESAFAQQNSRSRLSPAVAPLMSLLSRTGSEGSTLDELQTFFQRSLGATHLSEQIPPALQWLTRQTLAWQDENEHYKLTLLGQRTARAMLPPELAAGFAQLIRDLLSLDEKDQLLASWQRLDHLIILMLLKGRPSGLARFSSKLEDKVQSWCEDPDRKAPMLYREWINGSKGHSKAIEIFGSLGIPIEKTGMAGEEWARQQAYLTVFAAIVLQERGQGKSSTQLNRTYGISNLEGIEERWRDELLWLLSGLANLLDVRTFYYHLHEECDADPKRIKRVKEHLRRMRHQTYDLMGLLKYCSPLGPALRSMRRTFAKGIGTQSIRKLEEAGITDLRQLIALGEEGMVQAGIRRDIAARIQGYLRRRMQ